jgi:bifunctional non-homologous end joining protein LigD
MGIKTCPFRVSVPLAEPEYDGNVIDGGFGSEVLSIAGQSNGGSVVLDQYQRKRDFRKSPEPEGSVSPSRSGRLFVIQKHAARRLHYDLRLELNGVLKSWAVPKGPSLDPTEKRLAVEVEDHPVAYGDFEGVIPENQYGAGTVLVWDYGRWEPEGDPEKGLASGNLKFTLHGQKLKGGWALVRMNKSSQEAKKEWLLIKHKDSEAVREGADTILKDAPASVLTGRPIEKIARDRDHVWQEGRSVPLSVDTVHAAIDPGQFPQARKSDLPATFYPQLARIAARPPDGDGWLHEIKYDGYRLLCRIQDRRVQLITRNGHDWTDRFGEIVREAAGLPVQTAILDGEATVLRPDGTTDFQAMQNYFKGQPGGRLVYYLFDLPYCQGYDLSAVPLSRRKELLKQVLPPGDSGPRVMLLGGEIRGMGQQVFRNACRLGVEGIVSKRINAVYEQRRAATWVKIKCTRRQEFVIGGYSESKAAPAGLRSLLLGYYQAGRLTYAGRVGTGFSVRERGELKAKLDSLKQAASPFIDPPKGRGLHWARPDLVAEVAFSDWTSERLLRQPVFKGLREDKPADQVVVETGTLRSDAVDAGAPLNGASASASGSNVDIAGVRLTHPERILYPQFGLTKAALARYYQQVADRMLPYVIHRPLTLVRCPQGSSGTCFYQKHFNETLPESLKSITIREDQTQRNYIYIEDLAGLIGLAQINVLEIHPWGSRIDRIDAPDTLIFDIDPDPDLPWEHVVQAAWHLGGILQGRGFTVFVKNSGGKGLHVQMPLERSMGWAEVKRYAHDIALMMASQQPGRYTANSRKAARKGRIYIDYLRNARGATSVAPYSTRARAGAPVATPLFWEELSSQFGPATFTVNNIAERISQLKTDPWHDYARVKNFL